MRDGCCSFPSTPRIATLKPHTVLVGLMRHRCGYARIAWSRILSEAAVIRCACLDEQSDRFEGTAWAYNAPVDQQSDSRVGSWIHARPAECACASRDEQSLASFDLEIALRERDRFRWNRHGLPNEDARSGRSLVISSVDECSPW